MEITAKPGNRKFEKGENITAYIKSPGKLAFKKIKLDPLKPNQVKVKMIGCGLDTGDSAIWEGRDGYSYPTPYGVPGRGGWGVITEKGADSTFNEGDLVAIFTRSALAKEIICTDDQLVKLPAQYKNRFFPAKSLAHGYYVWKKAKVKLGDVVLTVGGGFISNIVSEFCNSHGAHVVNLSNNSNSCSDISFNWHEQEDLKDYISKKTLGKGCDVIIECTGTAPAFKVSTALINKLGSIVLARKPMDDLTKFHSSGEFNQEVICAFDTNKKSLIFSLNEVLALINAGNLIPEAYIGKTYNFEELEEALEYISNNSAHNFKTCLLF